MKLSDFQFDLPEHLIATRPMVPRQAARLLQVNGTRVSDHVVGELPNLLRPGDRLIVNNTRVIPSRLFALRHRETPQGLVTAKVELTLLNPAAPGGWMALAKPLRRLKLGDRISCGPLNGTVAEVIDGQVRLEFDLEGAALDAAIDAAGHMPLPPYIAARRAADDQDRTDYQTLFARHRGAVAAPTASLHVDAALLGRLSERGIQTSEVTLHVGAGTFLPVKVEDVTTHKMHAEWGQVSAQAVQEIAQTRREGGRVIALGTTAMRILETAAQTGAVTPWSGETDIFIYPGYQFNAIDGLITNFHLPGSTLLMLVSALMGKDVMQDAYAHAIDARYRFFSYGDASLLLPDR